MFYQKLMDQKLMNKLLGKHGLETEGRTEKSNPNFANHPNNEIAKIGNTSSTSGPLRLSASSRHLGEMMDIFKYSSSISRPVTASRSAALWR